MVKLAAALFVVFVAGCSCESPDDYYIPSITDKPNYGTLVVSCPTHPTCAQACFFSVGGQSQVLDEGISSSFLLEVGNYSLYANRRVWCEGEPEQFYDFISDTISITADEVKTY
jgi:hypothetical protein